ncbi:protein DBF4 homolog A isoform X2 [Polyodon spathula]|uniref:protein DBF4 homolog A isoform X2 n=1 Tax=Polyodon spathula TaxID=7913 RepID=UPI001B7EFDFF|nr:protein DBF4 homolog A isoform X2 [Polyodon spathula]
MKPGFVSHDANVKSKAAGIHEKTEKNKGTVKNTERVAEYSEAKSKPFAGKVFYLDLPYKKTAEALEKDIQGFGGTIERFFSKDIRYLVSNKKEARFAQSLGRNSPVPSPDSANNAGNSSPHPSSRRGSHKGSSHSAVDTALTSRGKSLVKKVIKEQELIPANRILSNALAWGVKILYIDDIKLYIEKKKKELPTLYKDPVRTETAKKTPVEKPAASKVKAGRLTQPFLKVEDRSRHYRPIYQLLPNLPEINFSNSVPCCPFDLEKKSKEGDRKDQHDKSNKMAKDQDCGMKLKAKVKIKAQDLKVKKKKGFCECCVLKYEDMNDHIKSERHKAFSTSKEYEVVDKVISQFVCDFVEFKKPKKRVKCSLGASVQTPTAGINNDGRQEIITGFAKSKGRHNSLTHEDFCCEDTAGASTLWNPTAESVTCTADSTVHATSNGHSCDSSILIRMIPEKNIPDTQISAQFHNPSRSNLLTKNQLNTPKRETNNLISKRQDTANFQTEKETVLNCGSAYVGKFSEAHVRLCRTDVAFSLNKQTRKRSACESSPKQKHKQNISQNETKYLKMSTTGLPDTESVERKMQNELFIQSAGDPVQEAVVEEQSTDIGCSPSRTRSSPSVKLQRKVKVLKRTKKRNEKQTQHVFSEQKKEDLLRQNACMLSPATEDLWQLFKTSEDMDYEFAGFSFSTKCEKSSSESVPDEWQPKHALFSLFTDAASSASTFPGF